MWLVRACWLIAAGRNLEVRYLRQGEKRLGEIAACTGIGGPHDEFVFERLGPAVKPIGKVGDGKPVLGNELAQPNLVAELVATEREMTMDEGPGSRSSTARSIESKARVSAVASASFVRRHRSRNAPERRNG